jgi:two-component system, chemotaxis family, protein-glutamate methylesterase/glutaminase
MNANSKPELMVIGGSAGSLSIVMRILSVIKKEMQIAVVIVLHRKQTDEATLVDLLATRTELEVKEADDKDEVIAGYVYVAPADYHVLVEKDKTLSLDGSEKVNYSRPSIDVTIESASEVYKDSMVAVLLSGANSDGVVGLIQARKQGALIVVQDPETAEFPVMPKSAVLSVPVDLLLNDNNFGSLVTLFV